MTTLDEPRRAGASSASESSPHSPFVPIGVESRFAAPRAYIDPDPLKSWLRRAWPIMLSHRRIFLSALILSFLGLLLQIQIPRLLADAITNSIQHHTVPIGHYGWWILALAIMAGVSGYFSRRFLLQTAYNIEFDLRNIIYEHLTRMSFPFYDRVQSGQLISRANSDIRSVQMYMTFAPLVIVQCSIAAVAFAIMLTISVPLAFVAMSTMPFVLWTSIKMRKSMFPISWLIQARLADVATIVDENINGVRVVKSFAAEQEQLTTLAKSAKRVEWAYVKDADIRARWTPLIQNLPQLGLALVLLAGGYMAIHGHFTVGDIVAFSSYLFMLQAPFMMLGMIVMMGQRAAASAGRIYEVLDERPTIVDRPGAVDLVECLGDVRFNGVTFEYDEGIPVLRDFDVGLRPGETVALVGRTGSGKTTVSRLLTRFYDVRSGSVSVDGIDIRDLTLMSLRSQVGVVLDEPFLFSMTVRDNIAYGNPQADFGEVEAAARAAGAHAFIIDLADGYDTMVGERGYTLSGGQRQRIAIARTLLMNPPILVLDDATSAIDVQVEQEIHEALRQLMVGRTTLIIAHRLSTISLADRVVLMEGGRVVAEGTHAELLATAPLYSEVLAQGDEAAETSSVLAQGSADEILHDSPSGAPVVIDEVD
jgi:ATP-binding cassette subfamily B protein